MSVTPEQLMAYADGELHGAEKAAVEAAIATDAESRAIVDRHRALRSKLSGAFASVLEEPPPRRLVEAVRKRGADVVDLGAMRARRAPWRVREWGAMAACLMVGVLVGGRALQPDTGLMSARGGVVEARGALARALETRLAADAGDGVRIGITFRDGEGHVCRTFAADEGAVSGLACRTDDAWRVQMAVAGARRETTEFRTAAVETPDAVLRLVEQRMVGDAFDAATERRARDGDWRNGD